MTATDDDDQPTLGGASKVPVGNRDKVRGRVFVGPVDEPDAYELLHPDRSVGGGEGTVWQAAYRGRFDRHLLYAVKRLDRPDGADMSWPDENVRTLWDDQVRLLERVTHPHLVKYHRIFSGWDVHEAGTRTGFPDPGKTCYFLLMDWVDGRSLATTIKTRDGTLAARVGWIAEIAAAIDHLHSGGQTGGIALFHHDVKPANIIVNELDGAVLVDCGLLRYDGDNSPTVQMFTPEYCDPWARDNPKTGASSDLYGLAATAYHAITGDKPQPHDPRAMADRIGVATNRSVPNQKLLAAHMLAVLGNPPSSRPESATSWAATLQQIAVGDPAQAGPRSPLRSTILKIFAIAIATVLALAGIFFALTHDNRTPHTGTSSQPGLGKGGAGGTTPAEAAVWLADGFSPTDNSKKPLIGVFAAGGKDVVHGVGLQPVGGRSAEVSYDIDGHYATFEFDLVIGDGGTPVAVHFDVLGDGTPLPDAQDGFDIASTAPPVSESIRVAGVRTLTLVATVPRGTPLPPQAIFANARLVPSGGSPVPTTAPPSSPAGETKWLDLLIPTESERLLKGVFAAGGKDVVHGVGLQPVSGKVGQVSYDIDGQYGTFEFDLVIGDGGTPAAVHFDVLGDGTPLPDAQDGFDVTADAPPESESIRVAGVRTLTLVATVPRGTPLPPQAIFANARLVP